jgi:hypothetical protein
MDSSLIHSEILFSPKLSISCLLAANANSRRKTRAGRNGYSAPSYALLNSILSVASRLNKLSSAAWKPVPDGAVFPWSEMAIRCRRFRLGFLFAAGDLFGQSASSF